MTVESLIKSAIADEVNAKLDPKIVKEIVDKKIQRLTKKILDKRAEVCYNRKYEKNRCIERYRTDPRSKGL